MWTALITALVVAYPLLWVASYAHAQFSGCWLSCGGDPQIASGLAWTLVGVVLLGLPLAAGLNAARVRSRAARAAGIVLVLLVATVWVLFSLDPDNANFFVQLGE